MSPIHRASSPLELKHLGSPMNRARISAGSLPSRKRLG